MVTLLYKQLLVHSRQSPQSWFSLISPTFNPYPIRSAGVGIFSVQQIFRGTSLCLVLYHGYSHYLF